MAQKKEIKVLYFQPKRHRTPTNRRLLKLIPRDKGEAWKADRAEQVLSEEMYVYYLALVLVHHAAHLLPKHHQENIVKLIQSGILDDLAMSCYPGITESCVTDDGKFIYQDQEYPLPKGYKPFIRVIDENGDIFVEAYKDDGNRKVYQFILQNGCHYWERISNREL